MNFASLISVLRKEKGYRQCPYAREVVLDAPHEDPASSSASLQGVQEDRQAHVGSLSSIVSTDHWHHVCLFLCF